MMTIGQIKKAASKYRYIGLRTPDNWLHAVNSKAIFMAIKRGKYPDNFETIFYSWESLSFNEYISKKQPFV